MWAWLVWVLEGEEFRDAPWGFWWVLLNSPLVGLWQRGLHWGTRLCRYDRGGATQHPYRCGFMDCSGFESPGVSESSGPLIMKGTLIWPKKGNFTSFRFGVGEGWFTNSPDFI